MGDRTVLDFDFQGEALSIADSWARTAGVAVLGNEPDGTRIYGDEKADTGIRLSIRQKGPTVHLEAWLYFTRGFAFSGAREEPILGGGYPAREDRWQARRLVNPLLAELGQPPIPDPPVLIALDMAPAGLGRRFLGVLLDALIVAFLLGAIGAATQAAGYSPEKETWTAEASLIEAVGLAITFFYVPAAWLFFGRTLGQRALGMRVVDGRTGSRLELGRVLVLYLLWLVLVVSMFPGFLAGLVAMEDPYQRSWLDKRVGSVVLKRA